MCLCAVAEGPPGRADLARRRATTLQAASHKDGSGTGSGSLAAITAGQAARTDFADTLLRDRGVSPQDITDVIFSHHHPDHTLNAALFPNARVHDHWAIYRNDTWQMRPAEGFELAGSIRLIETPGHTPQDVTTLVGTAEGVIALTHLWWTRQGPAEDPFASDSAA